MASFEGMKRAPDVAPAIEKKHRKELQEADIFVLEEGLKKLQRFFLSCPAEEFPQTLIFPDTSARPLAYAVKALVEDACHRRALPVPALRFFQAKRIYPVFHDATTEHEVSTALKEIAKVDVSPTAWKDLGSKLKKIQRDFAYRRELHREHDEQIIAQKSMRTRAETIIRETGSEFIMVIDDFMVEGGTLNGVKEAFAPLLPKKSHAFRSFAFCLYEENDSADVLDTPDEFFGITTRDVSSSKYLKGSRFTGFSYRENHPARVVGVVKDHSSPQVKLAPEARQDRMRALRQEMTEVATRVISSHFLGKGGLN